MQTHFHKKQSFYPPKDNSLVIGLAKRLTPFLFKTILGGLKVHIPAADLERLEQLKNERLLLLPNHPTEDDPYVLLALARKLGIALNSVAAREVFDWNGGLRGLMFQWLGCYSVIRGAIDRESFRMSRNLLIKGKNPLVIFIEGEITNENDTLIPFEPGVVQLAFWAQEELKDTGSVKLAPLALKYFYEPGAEGAIEKALVRLEKALNLQRTSLEPYERLRAIGQKILGIQEKRLGISPSEAPLGERIESLKNKILTRIENFLELRPRASSSILDRIRAVRNKMDKNIYTYDELEQRLSNYEGNILEELRLQYREFYHELERLVNFLVLHDGYIAEKQTPERFIETIRRLEHEVFGKTHIQHPRTACLKLGEVKDLQGYLRHYESDKKVTVQKLAQELELNMSSMLQEIPRPA